MEESENLKDIIRDACGETLPNRKIMLSDLEVIAPEFIYNRPWKQWPDHQVTFTVDMRNQELIGFFQPDKGDQVVVSGSFTVWSPGGIPLIDKSRDGVYRITDLLPKNWTNLK